MGSRILLADDSITIQKVVNLTFADEGIEVVAVSNGDTAERRLTEVKPDLVLADIFMPGKNGYELCDSIKNNSQFRNVPVVLLVGAFEPFDQGEARRVRADAHLTKPFESRTLVETVRRLISASPRTTTGPIAPTPELAGRGGELRDDAPALPSLASPQVPRLDLSAMTERNAMPASPTPRRTGELASPAPAAGSDAIGVGVLEMPDYEVAATTLTDTGDRFEPMEFLSGSEFERTEMISPLEIDTQEMVVDFNKAEPFGSLAPQKDISFDADASSLLDVDVSGVGEGAEWRDRESIETTRLEMPSGARHEDTRADFAASGPSAETTSATLLAVDDPLGDVLLDDAIQSEPAQLATDSSTESFKLDLTESEAVEGMPPTQFDLVGLTRDARSEASTQSTSSENPESVPSESQLVSESAANNRDWTSPRAGVYSTAQLDSVVMPFDSSQDVGQISEQSEGADQAGIEIPATLTIEDEPNVESAEPAAFGLTSFSVDEAPQIENPEPASFELTGFSVEEASPQKTPEPARFATSPLWTEEEVRFAPIDIEGVPVEQTEPMTSEPSAVTAGFSFAAVPEPPELSAETRSPDAAPDSTNGTASQGVELSQASIEEIVRRVVAEMSTSVVREVAWEVVPDCVERVVEQLTRESLTKQV